MNKIYFFVVSLIVSQASFSATNHADKGKEQAQICSGCHGENGKSSIPGYPNLAGQNKIYIETQLKNFRDDNRTSPIMSPMAKSLSDEEIVSLADYYSKI